MVPLCRIHVTRASSDAMRASSYFITRKGAHAKLPVELHVGEGRLLGSLERVGIHSREQACRLHDVEAQRIARVLDRLPLFLHGNQQLVERCIVDAHRGLVLLAGSELCARRLHKHVLGNGLDVARRARLLVAPAAHFVHVGLVQAAERGKRAVSP